MIKATIQTLRLFWQRSVFNKLLIILIMAFLIFVVEGYTQSWYFSWTGFGDYAKPTGVDERGKTLWDWLDLLIIPAVLAFGALWFNRAERKSEREIADNRLREETLQAYLHRITDLLLKEDLRKSKEGDEVRAIARARTLATLRRLDGERNKILLEFLQESGLTNKDDPIIHLRGANLSKTDLSRNVLLIDLVGADLSEANLSGTTLLAASLSGTKLYRVNLSEAILFTADLREADLREANLSGANLSAAKLVEANLCGANLCGAFLTGTDLCFANLSGAYFNGADLSLADLSGAYLDKTDLLNARVTTEQLNTAKSLKGAILPDGTKHD